MGAGHRKDQAMIRSLKLSISGERKETGDSVNYRSCLCDKAAIKIPELWGLESLQVTEHIHLLEAGVPKLHGGNSFGTCDPSRPHLRYPFIGLFICILYILIINQ